VPRRTIEERVYYLGVRRCKRTHPDLFARLVREGSRPNGYGPPCQECRIATHKQVTYHVSKKSAPWETVGVRRSRKKRKKDLIVTEVDKWLMILGHI
jgi:hypothetical protein